MTLYGRQRVNRQRSGGFTLLELLVAIMILTLLMAVSISSVRIAGQSVAAGIDGADTTEEMRAVSNFLRNNLAGLPPLVTGEGRERRLQLKADAKSLLFVAPAPRYSYGSGLMVYELAAEQIDGLEYLTLAYAPFDPGNEEMQNPPARTRRIISRGFEVVTFDYFGAEMKKETAGWKSEWREDADNFPRAVRIRTRADTASDGWPDLVYPLRSGIRS